MKSILTIVATALVILPVLTGRDRRTHAAIFSFWAGVIPPLPMPRGARSGSSCRPVR
jgi:hypothetical protein